MKKIVLAAALLAVPLAARADIGLRLGGDATIAYHDAAGTHDITSNWPLGLDAMLSYWTPGSILSLDLEVGEQFAGSPPPGGSGRLGTVLRPGIRLSPPVLPIYARAAIPIIVEAPGAYSNSRGNTALRLGAGINIPLVLFKIYLEGDADFLLGGGTNAPSAFSNWNLLLNGGVDFRF